MDCFPLGLAGVSLEKIVTLNRGSDTGVEVPDNSDKIGMLRSAKCFNKEVRCRKVKLRNGVV